MDRIEYDAVTYICGGAVSGGWWGGDYAHFPPAYVLLDWFDDGRVEHRTVFYEKA